MTKFYRTSIGLAAVAAALTLPAQAELIYGLSGTNIVSFDSATPGVLSATRAITGLNAFDALLQIDVRPQDGLLYAYSLQSRLYNLNLSGAATAVATQVVGPFTSSMPNTTVGITSPSMGTPGVTTTGGSASGVAIDFNPQANALRLEDSNDGNFRLPFATTPTTSSLIGDGQLRITSPGDFGVAVAAAYTNNFVGAGSTALYVLDATNNSLYLQTNPNNGVLQLVGNVGNMLDIPPGAVGFDVSGTGNNNAYASFASPGVGRQSLYTVNLSNGAVTLVGLFGVSVTDIAAATVPEPGSAALLAGAAAGLLGLRRRRQS